MNHFFFHLHTGYISAQNFFGVCAMEPGPHASFTYIYSIQANVRYRPADAELQQLYVGTRLYLNSTAFENDAAASHDNKTKNYYYNNIIYEGHQDPRDYLDIYIH